MTCLDAIIVILAHPTMPCIHLVILIINYVYMISFLHIHIIINLSVTFLVLNIPVYSNGLSKVGML